MNVKTHEKRATRQVSVRLGIWLVVALGAELANAAESDVRRDATVMAIEKVVPSVVNIATETIVEINDWYDTMLRQFYGWHAAPLKQRSFSLGSGVIIDEEGYLLTNFHVVDRANRIQIKLWDGREYEADRISATTGSDVALLKIRAKPGEKFRAIKLAADDDLLLGETVMAVGNPYGLGGSVTKGILSSKNRRPSTGNEPLEMEDWLQTDAAINPGNSGGPLVNLRGELIGLNVAVYRGEQGERGVGVGFSIPVKQVSAALARFFTPEVLEGLWFGGKFRPGLGPLRITSVQPDSPAGRAGLRSGDEIVQVNGQEFRTFFEFNRLLSSGANREAKLLVNRNGDRRTLTARLLTFEDLLRQKLGLTFTVPQPGGSSGGKANDGLYIDQIQKDGPASQAGLQPGYIVTAADGRSTRTLWDVVEVALEKRKGERVRFTVVAPTRRGPFVELRQGAVDVTVR